MDIEMPEQDGYKTTEKIREWEKENQKVPLNIIALSAHAESESRDKAILSGMNEFLSKPVKISELKAVLSIHD
jgi:CheY-like chemotaxis protein